MLKIKVLVENNTYIDHYYLGEPALSYFIETDQKKILFDTGYSNAYILNAKKMGIDLNNLDYLVLSHGHNDHTGGLVYLINEYDLSKTILIAHPDVFIKREDNGLMVGSPLNKNDLDKYFKEIILTKDVYKLSDNFVFLGEINRSNDFENKKPVGYIIIDNYKLEDYLKDDTGLAYQGSDGLFIISACSHSGICNITNQAIKYFNEDKIEGIIGGFHLFNDDETLDKTIDYLSNKDIKELYPCHCVSLVCKHKMMNKLNVKEVGVGLEIVKE